MAVTTVDVVVRLSVAVALGGALGVEREIRRKPAGIRTNILIALGAALFTIVSFQAALGGGTPDRIAAQIITGVGFLGGGAILRERAQVTGLTTAATIWVNAAIGMAAGIGAFDVAVFAAIVALVVLWVVRPIEQFVDRRSPQPPDPVRRD